MNTTNNTRVFPDLYSQPTAHKFTGNWDTVAVARIIREKSQIGRTPAFLFLGREETELLRTHLGQAFGEDSVTTLHESYYMGLKVVPVDAEKYISTGGSKAAKTIQAPDFRSAS